MHERLRSGLAAAARFSSQPDSRQVVAENPRGQDIAGHLAIEPRAEPQARTVDLRVDIELVAALAVAVHQQVTATIGLFVEAIILTFFMRHLVAVMVGAVGERLLTVNPMVARNANARASCCG